MEHGFSYYMEQGGISIYPLLLFSILGVAVVLERAYHLVRARKSLKGFFPMLIQAVRDRRTEEAQEQAGGKFFCRIFQAALAREGQSEGQILRSVERARAQEIEQLRSRTWILGTIGSLAPFVGLFGTVVGIMHAFGEIARTQEGGFTTVSAGISEALIATAAGLLIAVLSVLAYNFFSTQINQVSFQLKSAGEKLAELLASPRGASEKNLTSPARK